MQPSSCIAIVGRPNVGKSRLFNCLSRGRNSIVFDRPGVTRDIISSRLPNGATLLDTGGLGQNRSPLDLLVDGQVQRAISMADTILFVLDGREGLTAQDLEIGRRLRRSGKRVIVIVNKIDSDDLLGQMDEVFALGFTESPLAVSAEHRRGIDLLERLLGLTGNPAGSDPVPTVALVGAPNAGKSSIMNRLLSSPRAIVSDVAGTTRDSITDDLQIESLEGNPIRLNLVDTAGLRLKKKLASPIEYFAALRTGATIHRADLSLLVLDATQGLTRADKKMAESVAKTAGNLAIVVNKWDLVEARFRADPPPGYDSPGQFQDHFGQSIRRELYGWPEVPVLCVSALLDRGFDEVRRNIRRLLDARSIQIATGPLNRFLASLLEQRRPPKQNGKQFKIFYGLQTGTGPQTLRIYCNDRRLLDRTYEAYLRRRCLEKFLCGGCNLVLNFVPKAPKGQA